MAVTVEEGDLLQQLGRHVRGEGDPSPGGDPPTDPADDPVWDRLAKGELPAEEHARLRERASADPEIAQLYEAFRPLDGSVKATIAARAEASLRRPRVVRLRRVALVAGPLAAAAVLLLVLRLPRPRSGDVLAAVPEYSLDLTGGDRTTRSGEPMPAPAPGTAVDLHRGSHLEIVLRPATAVKQTVAVHAFLVQGDVARPWDVPMERSADGAVRVSGQAGSLLGVPPGSWDLVFTVSSAGAAAPEPADVARAARGEAAGGAHPWRLLDARVHLLDEP